MKVLSIMQMEERIYESGVDMGQARADEALANALRLACGDFLTFGIANDDCRWRWPEQCDAIGLTAWLLGMSNEGLSGGRTKPLAKMIARLKRIAAGKPHPTTSSLGQAVAYAYLAEAMAKAKPGKGEP